jgi:hypothetical protein
MSRRTPGLKVLEARKQLLLAESRVNRAELPKELDHLKDEINRVKKNVCMAGSIASSAALLTTTASIFRRHFNSDSSEQSGSRPKTSWISTALNHATTGTSLFLKLRSLFRNRT